MTQETITLTPEEAALYYLQAIKDADAKAAEARAYFESIVSDLIPFKAAIEAELHAAKLRVAARAYFEANPVPVVTTDDGKMGIQERKAYTFSAASVRELAPDLVPFVVRETVDATALKKFVPTVIKTGNAPEDLMVQLEARAEVKVTKAFICELKG